MRMGSLPIIPTEPLCFCNVDGCSLLRDTSEIGGAKIAVGDDPAWYELKDSNENLFLFSS